MSFVLVCDAKTKNTFCVNLLTGNVENVALPGNPLQFIQGCIRDFVERKYGCKDTISWDWIEANQESWRYFFLQFDFLTEKLPSPRKTPSKTPRTQTLKPKTPKKTLNKELAALGNTRILARRTRRRGGSLRNVTAENIDTKGFVGAHEKKKGEHVYLDIICSKKNGRLLLEYFLSHFKDFKTIELSALANVLAYYPKFGFEFKKGCGKKGVGIDAKKYAELEEYVKMQKQNNKPLPEDNFEAYEDSEFLKFQGELVNKGLAVKLSDDRSVCGKQLPNESNRSFMKRLKDQDCAEDGYTMVKCRA
jgi:hypothetical protein